MIESLHLNSNPILKFAWLADQKDMVKLAQLQNRAANYVLYYARFAKSRLKFGLIEDVIQYDIALINFIITE